jgi:hypothetical protein
MHQTNVDRALAALEEKFSDDPERSTLVRLTRRFKASWLELAEALTDVKRHKTWERWGHDSFESYTKGELKLRNDTVEKLTGSYMFLNKKAPEVLKRDPLDAPLPSYQAIDFLRRAEERDDVPEETIADVRRKILDEGAPMATVARLYKDTLFPVSEDQKKDSDKKAIKTAATKLRDMLAETKAVPRKVANEAGEAIDRLLENLSGEAKAA